MEKRKIIQSKGSRVRFDNQYRDEAFVVWYHNGRPGSTILVNLIAPDDEGFKPALNTINTWISAIFRPRAEELDSQVTIRLEELLVKERIEMLRRHSETGQKMQNIALEYLDTHKEDLSSATAVRMLVDGIRVERESRGIPEALQKMSQMTDDELLKEIEKIIQNSPLEIEPNV